MTHLDPLLCQTGSLCSTCHHFDEASGACGLVEQLQALLGSAPPALVHRPAAAFADIDDPPFRPGPEDTVPLEAWIAEDAWVAEA